MKFASKKPNSYEKKKKYWGYFFTFPLITGIVFLFMPNMIQTFIFSLNDMSVVTGGYTLKVVWFYYYQQALQVNPEFTLLLGDAIKQLVMNLPVILIFSLFISVLLNQNFRGRTISRAIFFIPVILAAGVINKVENSSTIMNIVDVSRGFGASDSSIDFNFITSLLDSVKFGSSFTDFILAAANSIYSIVSSSGIQIFIFLGALQEIPDSLYEAAKVEGCTQWDLFWKITLPMISPQIIICGIYTIVDIFVNPSSTLVAYIDNISYGLNQFSYGTAMYLIYFVCVSAIISILGLITVKIVAHKD